MSETQQRTELQRVLEEQKPYLSLPSSSIELFEYSMQHRYIDIKRRIERIGGEGTQKRGIPRGILVKTELNTSVLRPSVSSQKLGK